MHTHKDTHTHIKPIHLRVLFSMWKNSYINRTILNNLLSAQVMSYPQ